MRDRSPRILTVLAAITFLMPGVFLGCEELTGTGEGPPPVTTEYGLVAAQSCSDVQEAMVVALTEQILNYRYTHYGLEFDGGVPINGAPQDRGTDSPTDYTTTNVQEEGVDEIDIIKTDGDYIYTVIDNDLVIVDSWPVTEVSEVGRVALADDVTWGWAPGLLLKDDRIAVFSSIYEERRDGEDATWFDGTRITIVDVTQRNAPVVERRVDVEGWYVDGRLVDGEVYLVVNGRLALPSEVWDIAWSEDNGLPEPEYDASEARQLLLQAEARPIVKRKVRQALANLAVTDILPERRELDANGAITASQPLFDCTDLYLPPNVSQIGALSVVHVSLDDPTTFGATGVLADGWEVYASLDNLYVAMSSRSWWWGWGSPSNETHIHKFGLRDPTTGHPAYVASGRVDGWLLNQFSMSEHNGYLRVATTDNEWIWDQDTETTSVVGGNHVSVLQQAGSTLNVVGSIRDIAPGEQIFASRMMGDKGYLVTFERTDPLFTLDLSDPTNPRVLGELVINGFSSYLHPVGDSHLLSIGQDADDEGRVLGVHLQIFDVSDMSNPTRTHHAQISTGSWSSWSEAMWDHHAFTYHPEKEMLAFPVNIYEWDGASGENFSGLLLYRASAQTGFEEVGRVDHGDLVARQWCESNAREPACEPGLDYTWWTTVRRSVFIEDYVYSLSDVGLKVNDLFDPETEHAAIVLR